MVDIFTIWFGINSELIALLELWGFGFPAIFLGIALTRAQSVLGSIAKITAILDILLGICLVLVITSLVGAILVLPAIIAEILLLYKAYQLFGPAKQHRLVMNYARN